MSHTCLPPNQDSRPKITSRHASATSSLSFSSARYPPFSSPLSTTHYPSSPASALFSSLDRSSTGIVLDTFVSWYEGFAVLAIIMSDRPSGRLHPCVAPFYTARLALEEALRSYSAPTKPGALLSMPTRLVFAPCRTAFLV
ncbi:hypothetical protein D9619_008737 [Psilocybe cf. subviscida]|uniref:Uncharacterized protein n=1 Tax=Psilocybe cf. subviscida TaxID=2480587 RepID=A0A8H5BA89_9AGAR|nr:hypothetical protein D9619_008737 [Psilocybe cf. subviscida]